MSSNRVFTVAEAAKAFEIPALARALGSRNAWRLPCDLSSIGLATEEALAKKGVPLHRGIIRFAILPTLLALIAAHATAGTVTVKLTDAQGQPVSDAIVSLVPLAGPPRLEPPAKPVEIAQEKQEFVPYVTAIQKGTSVAFPNKDEVEHHLYSQSTTLKFNKPLYKPGDNHTLIFDQAGVVTVGCNIHDWMIAYIVVLETPWFSKTGADGSASVAGVPAGRYRAEIWQPRLAQKEVREVTVTDAASAPEPFKLTLRPDRRIRRTPSTATGGYK